jgi:TonB family protein
MSRTTLCLILLAALALPGAASAQSARIQGTFTDETGGALPAVEVRAVKRDGSGETIRSTATDAAGRFAITDVMPGEWAITAALPGFELATRRLTLEPGDMLREWNAVLRLGSLQETITILPGPTPPPTRATGMPVPAQTPQASPSAPPPAGLVRVGGNIKPPLKVADVRPAYPTDLAARGVGGVVILQGVIDANGLMRDIKPLRSPNETLTQSAIAAFSDWEFTPTLLNGSPVEARITATFQFRVE